MLKTAYFMGKKTVKSRPSVGEPPGFDYSHLQMQLYQVHF